MTDFLMPSLGADMERGKVVRWLVQPGAQVHRGDIVLEVETEKATMDVEAFLEGTLDEILVSEGEVAPVGTVLARFSTAEGAASGTPASYNAAQQRAAPAPSERPAVTGDVRLDEASRPRVTPRARRLATERGLDVTRFTGTGPAGAVTGADLERGEAAQPHPERPEAATLPPSVARQRVVGALMARSKREIPHYYLGRSINLARSLEWLTATNASRPPAGRITVAALLLRATALAVRHVPEVNGYWQDGRLALSTDVHLGVAIGLRDGTLVAPAIADAQSKPLDAIMEELRGLVVRARSSKLRASEMANATLTVTNLGDQGAEYVHGVIYPPQVAIVGYGQVAERPVARDGQVVTAPVVAATLAGDHRASNGHRGSQYLRQIDQLLQDPETL